MVYWGFVPVMLGLRKGEVGSEKYEKKNSFTPSH